MYGKNIIVLMGWENLSDKFASLFTQHKVVGLEISVGHRTMTDRNKCLTNLKLFQSDIVSKRKIKTEMKYLYNVSVQA